MSRGIPDSAFNDAGNRAEHRRGVTKRRSGVIHSTYPPRPRMLFAYTEPDGRLKAVIDAESLDDAWVIATGWGDQRDIQERKMQGWRLSPAMLEWDSTQ